MPDIKVWTSDKTSPDKAERQLAAEMEKMAKKGYTLRSRELVEAGRSKKSWVALGLVNFARSKQMQIVATFERQPQAE